MMLGIFYPHSPFRPRSTWKKTEITCMRFTCLIAAFFTHFWQASLPYTNMHRPLNGSVSNEFILKCLYMMNQLVWWCKPVPYNSYYKVFVMDGENDEYGCLVKYHYHLFGILVKGSLLYRESFSGDLNSAISSSLLNKMMWSLGNGQSVEV